jgi:hypothetical protein
MCLRELSLMDGVIQAMTSIGTGEMGRKQRGRPIGKERHLWRREYPWGGLMAPKRTNVDADEAAKVMALEGIAYR